jgi:UDP-N-acetylmuramoyl-tripeptide--D-alanyl-D-alanine ligase
MERLKIAEIARAIRGQVIQGQPEIEVAGISIDTRSIKPGELYIAIRGKRLDGHQFVAEAMERGAAAVMVERQTPGSGGPATVIQVQDTKTALLTLARWYRAKLAVQVVAVTGSNGKTTTKEMLAEILKGRFRVVKARASFNNEIGVPLTVLNMDRSTEIGIFEIEMNELGGTRRLAEVCQPQIGIVTNVGDTHLEFMHNRNGVAQEKAELLEVLSGSGVAIINADDPLVLAMLERFPIVKAVTFGLGEGAAVFARGVRELGLDGTEFLFMGRYPVRLKVPGRHNIYNFLAAGAAARTLGLGFEEIAESIAQFSALAQRGTIRKLKGVLLIDESFNANPQSMAAALAVLQASGPKERRVAILGDMLELGAQSGKLHQELGRVAAGIVDRLVVIGKQAGAIARGALNAGFPPDRLKSYEQSNVGQGFSLASAPGAELFDIFKPGDIILVKGSRAMALELIIERIVRHYGEETG